jgi:predicted ATPase/DNA-binding SARP family transcriptional activator
VEFRLLGPLEVIGDDGLPVALGGPRPRALLAQLLLQPNRAVSTDRLIDGIWGEAPPASAHNALQVHVHALRSVLGADRITTRAPGYLVRVEEDELDVERFGRLVEQSGGAGLREALALWRGPALADFAYEPFAQAAAIRLDESRLAALEQRIALDLDAGRHAALVAELEALASAHPRRERLQAQRVLALYRAGRQADALAAYREARDALDELGLEPTPELRALERRVLEQDPSLAPPEARALPVPAEGSVELIGRARELASVVGLLERDDVRLVTLTGPGGTGKTTLALAAAAQLGGAPFVDLAPLTDASRVPTAIAGGLGLEEHQGEPPLETIARALDDRERVLVVVDNLEHLPECFPEIARLLDAARSLRILATSRGPLHVAAEREYRVPPLEVPPATAGSLEAVSTTAAVRLYAERARESVPEFELTEENAASIARITRALDGLPLAIELAAARVRVLGVEGTAKRLGEALALLTRNAPDLPERQRSLRAAIDWSVRLLEPPARHALAVLAIFPGGATLEALEATADPETDVDTRLEQLLDAGLVGSSLAHGSELRFTMLETIRAYALAELEPERLDELRRRQLGWCIELAEDGGTRSWERGTPWLDRVEPELANVDAALDFARETDDVTGELRLAASMRHMWRVRGHGVEARRRMEDAVTRIDRVEPALRGRVLQETAVMRMAAGDYEGARAAWLAAMELFEELGDELQIGRVYAELAALANASGDSAAAIEYGEEAARRFADEEFLRLIVLGNLAESYEQTGDLERGRTTALEVLEAQRRIGDRDGVAYMSFALASMATAMGDVAEAHRRVIECLTVAAEVGFVELTAYALGIAADLAVALDRPEDAALLLESSREGFRRIGSAPQVNEVERHERIHRALAERLDDVDGALERGRALRQDDAVALAMGLDARSG